MSPLYGIPTVAGRNVTERVDKPPDLDPDIAMWPITPLSRWPFTGSPTEGVWPKGWMGVDAAAAVWVCTVAGEPGTWVQLGSGGGEGWPASNGTGPGNLTAETPDDDTVGYQMTDQGSGGINLDSTGTGALGLSSAAGIDIADNTGGITIEETGGTEAQPIVIENNATVSDDDTVNAVQVLATGDNADVVIAAEGANGGVTIAANPTPGSGAAIVLSSPSTVLIGGLEVSINNVTGTLGFFGVTPHSRQTGGGITTVAELVTVLQNYGLLS